uniref:SWI/SNF-related matrix-associated actin-dependent regulator of chromatin subfamily A containing DEAD/H box 1 homolog n=1 Tax=Acrobeloides nanus TaxID=290746 RepID=A0A914C232_9BILA
MSEDPFASPEKRRIAHTSAANPEVLMKELAYKRQKMMEAALLSNKKTPMKRCSNAPQSMFRMSLNSSPKKSKKGFVPRIVSSDEEMHVEDSPEKKFQSPVKGEENGHRRIHTLSSSDSEATSSKNDEAWLCKPRLNGEVLNNGKSKSKIQPPKQKFSVRARLDSSSDSSNETGEKDDITNKKSLKSAIKQARRNKRHSGRMGEEDELALSSSADGDDDENIEDSFDSDDSDAAEHRNKKITGLQKILQDKCLKFLNELSLEELANIPRFNERVASFIVEKRPFDSFNKAIEALRGFPRGTTFLDQYMEFLENRSILDEVLDDCKRYSQTIQDSLQQIDKMVLLQPKTLNPECKLHTYQQVGLNWLIMMDKLNLNAILADEMGLGKTVQVIAFLTYLKEKNTKGPHLIVVPSSTIENWLKEMQKWSPTLKYLTYYGSISDREEFRATATKRKDIDVILTTYNMICSRPEDRKFFKKFSLNYVIYDEGHMLRSCNTQRYQNLMKVRGARKLLLTGTPLQNNLVELISLMFFTMTKMFTEYVDNIKAILQLFAAKSVNKVTNKHKSNGKSQMNNELDDDLYEKHKIVQAKAILQPFILRRLKENVLTFLPPKSEYVKFCEMTESQQQIYEDVIFDLRAQRESGMSGNPAGGLMIMRQAANHPLLYRRQYLDEKLYEIAKTLCTREQQYSKKNYKHVAEDMAFLHDIGIHQICAKFSSTVEYCLDMELALNSGKCKMLDRLLPPIKEKKEKVLIFSQFTSMLDILEMYLALRNHNFCRLDGSTAVMERQELIDKFNANEEIFIFLLSTKAGGLGINLTAANHIIIHDIDFNPYNDKQAEDRCHRMGQEKNVTVTRLISEDTIEEPMLALAQKKLELEKDVTNVDEGPDSETISLLISQALSSSSK